MIFKPSDRDRAIKFIDALFLKSKHIKIEHVPEAKTLSQNSYLWLVFTHIGFETGANKDDMHDYYLNKFPRFKEVEHLGQLVHVRITLRSFTKEQMMSFIDEVVTDARMEGFDVPNCEDKKCLDMIDYYRQKGLI
jgi:hypothetical protein